MITKVKYISPWIHISDACNCKCDYCFVSDNKIVMQPEILYNLNKYVFEKMQNDGLGYCKYRIAGGEPLLFIDKWYDPIKEFLDNIGDKGGVEILSNFTIYPEKLDSLLQHKNYCNINMSLDGLTCSKPYRSGDSSSRETVNNIQKYISKYNRQPFVMTVITDDGNYLPDLAWFIIDIKGKWEIQLDKCYDANINPDIINENMKRVLNIFAMHNYPVENILYNFCDLETTRICENGKSMFAILPDGTIQNCQMQLSKIGKFPTDDLLTVLANNKTHKVNKNTECQKCVIAEYCHGDCPNGDIRRKKYMCKVMKHYVLNALKLKLTQEVQNA